MGTWVICPNCIKNLPKKYQNKKERKEIHQATCDECKNKVARKHYETGVKRGIWLKKWKKASESFNKAGKEFQNINEEESQLQCEIMGLLSKLNNEKNKVVDKDIFQKIISGRFDRFIGQNFKIQGFTEFDPLYYEAKAWNEYFKIDPIKNIHNRTTQMKAASHEFFNIGYGLLFFSNYILKKKKTNVELALDIEAEAEEDLGEFYASRGDIDFASVHLNNAVSVYLSLEQKEKANKLKMIRQSLRMETACWVCGARSKGHKKTFNYKFTGLHEDNYNMVLSLLKQRQERNPSFFNNTIYTTKEPIKVIQNEIFGEKKSTSKVANTHEQGVPQNINTAAKQENPYQISLTKPGNGLIYEEDEEIAISHQGLKSTEGIRGIYLSICITCQGLVDELAQNIVDKALIPVWKEIFTLKSEMNNVYSMISDLKSQIDSIKRKMIGFKRG